MHKMRKQIATVGLAAALVAGGAGALALVVPAVSSAQSTPDTSTTPSGDRSSKLAETLQPLIDAGTITQEQADAVIAALEAARPEGDGHGRGPGGRGPGLDAAATALGVTEEELVTALADGQSIAEFAAARGVDVQTVVDAMVADAKAHLDEEVAEGDLTQAEADARLAEVTEKITAMVNGEMPPPAMGGGRGPGGHGRGGPMGPMGHDAEGSSEAPGSTTPSALTPSAQGTVRTA
jgi:polyhydroxyalkanoate synthesis regulator phasin